VEIVAVDQVCSFKSMQFEALFCGNEKIRVFTKGRDFSLIVFEEAFQHCERLGQVGKE
jgi:hypothetical protein